MLIWGGFALFTNLFVEDDFFSMLWCSFLFDVFDVKRFFSDINVLVISERSLTRSPTLLLFWLMWVPFTDCPFAKLIEPCIKLQSITKTINEIDFAPSSFLFKQMNFLFANLIFNALLFAFQVNFYTFIVISDTLLIFAIVFVTIFYYSFTINKFFHYSWVIFMVILSYRFGYDDFNNLFNNTYTWDLIL